MRIGLGSVMVLWLASSGCVDSQAPEGSKAVGRGRAIPSVDASSPHRIERDARGAELQRRIERAVQDELSDREIGELAAELSRDDCELLMDCAQAGHPEFDWRERRIAIHLLAGMRERVPAVEGDLLALVDISVRADDGNSLYTCLLLLRDMKLPTERIGPRLLRAFRQAGSPNERRLIGSELAALRLGGAEVIAALRPDLDAKDSWDRRSAAETLSWCTPPVSPDGDEIRRKALGMIASDSECDVRVFAGDLLRRWSVDASLAGETFVRLVRSWSPADGADEGDYENKDFMVARALAPGLRGDLDPVLAALGECVASKDPVIRARGVVALSWVRFEKLDQVETALGLMQQATKDGDPLVVAAVAEADKILNDRAHDE